MGIEPVIPNVVAFQGDDMFGWHINLTGNDLLTGEKARSSLLARDGADGRRGNSLCHIRTPLLNEENQPCFIACMSTW
ncbi:hypothetical protein [Chloroflexus sp. Y-396-1]|uniref:hypothetical protein n=1 Tax=Chloroflexus sp. Y-396-1 TaxID=867845 RepID=UPI00048B2338|nr:hypothetical protein [Chloroflexus sp. Y-396-1]